MIECKACEGMGTVTDVAEVISTPDGPAEVMEEFECEECGGTGEVQLIKNKNVRTGD